MGCQRKIGLWLSGGRESREGVGMCGGRWIEGEDGGAAGRGVDKPPPLTHFDTSFL